MDGLDLASLYSVKGKVALVTGGGSGIGSYIACALAVNGASVYLVGRRKDKLEQVVRENGALLPASLILLGLSRVGEANVAGKLTACVTEFRAFIVVD